MSSTIANGRSVQHKGDGNKHIAMAPDVCKTPSPGGPVPIPYPNFAFNSDLTKGTKKVKIEGNMVAVKGSYCSTSTGDEPGTAGGGIFSSKTKGKLKWTSQSLDVKYEGKGVIRFMEPNQHNANVLNTVGMAPGVPYLRPPDEDVVCPHCDKPYDDHLEENGGKGLPTVESTDESIEAMKDAREAHPGAHVVGGLSSEGSSLTAQAGGTGGLDPGNFAQTARNFRTGRPLNVPDALEFEPGNCAEQKLAHEAFQGNPVAAGSTVGLAVGPQAQEPPTRMVPAGQRAPKKAKDKRELMRDSLAEPCGTCQVVLLGMFCLEEEDAQGNSLTPVSSGDG